MNAITRIITFSAMIALCLTANAASYTYDRLNRLTQVTYASGQVVEYTYDAAGNILSVTSTLPVSRPGMVMLQPGTLSDTDASFNATFGPRDQDLTAYFEYGETSAYGSRTGTIKLAAGAGQTGISASVGPFEPGKAYHSRLVVSDGTNTWYSADRQFVAGAICSYAAGDTAVTNPFTGDVTAVATDGSRFVAVGGSGAVASSTDGLNWTAGASGTTAYLTSLIWDGTRFVAVGSLGTVLASSDGSTWTTLGQAGTAWLESLLWTGGEYVGVGRGGTIYTSPTGTTWTARTSGTTATLTDIAWNGALFVAVGWSGTLLTSPDAVQWTAVDIGGNGFLAAVVWNGYQFVASGPDRTHVLTSQDGVTWTSRYAGSYSTGYDLLWDGNAFVMVGAGGAGGTYGAIKTSPDAIAWSEQSLRAGSWLYGAAFDGHQLVAVGKNGTILRSSCHLSPGIRVIPISGLVTTESGGTDTFSVVLDSAPSADVSLNLTSSDPSEGTVFPASLTFTSADWNQAQTVTVTGVDDSVQDGDIGYSILTSIAASNDPHYQGLAPDDVSVTNRDDDSGDCHPGSLPITDEVFHGIRQIRAEGAITTSGSVTVFSDAAVTFEAGDSITFGPGFSVHAGGVLQARIGAVECAASQASQRQTPLIDSRLTPMPAPHPLTFDELPERLRVYLEALGLDAEDLSDISASADAAQIVFSTEAALVADDDNGESDIYRYQGDDDSLWLVSRASNDAPGNGPSDQPRIDGWGEAIVYRSHADNLGLLPDTNGVADIYHHDIPTRVTARASWGESGEEPAGPAAHPDLGGESLQIVFDRQELQTGQRGIYRYDPQAGVYSERQDPGDCDAHHPVLSADGAYLAYLCGEPSDFLNCQVRFQHLASGERAASDCPAEIAPDFQLFFDQDTLSIRWYNAVDPESTWEAWSINPLVRHWP